MVDLKNEPTPTPKKTKHGLSMSTVKNWFVPDKKPQESNFKRMPETFLRSLRRRSLRVKRTKSLVLTEKRKSGELLLLSKRKTKMRLEYLFLDIASDLYVSFD